jgi:hypothetical protein
MRLQSERNADGVVTISAIASDGRSAAVADFWQRPLIDGFSMRRVDAEYMQQNFADLLVSIHNRHFTAADQKEVSSEDIAVDALDTLLRQLDLTPPDYETHPELCAAIDAAKEDLITIKTRVFAALAAA